MTKTILIASQNPVKIEATRQGFVAMFPDETFSVSGISVSSGVSDQPMNRAETLQGAKNRAQNAVVAQPEHDFFVGIEGGVADNNGRLEVFAWVFVLHQGQTGSAQTGIFYLPQEVTKLIHAGYELGDADDKVFGRNNSKQQSGSIGLLTGDALTRTSYYVQAVIMALIPFKHPDFTWAESAEN
ncbi:MAG: inosine/xanthosine triphosphatase [Aggregatilineales bacterium]